MKRLCALVLALLCLLAACGKPAGNTEPPKPPAIRALEVTYRAAQLTALEDAEPWGRYWVEPDTVYADLTHSPSLAWSLVVGESTAFPGGLPEGYDLQALVEWGKDPGLNVDILHAHGFTGKGAVIAYIDMPALPICIIVFKMRIAVVQRDWLQCIESAFIIAADLAISTGLRAADAGRPITCKRLSRVWR